MTWHQQVASSPPTLGGTVRVEVRLVMLVMVEVRLVMVEVRVVMVEVRVVMVEVMVASYSDGYQSLNTSIQKTSLKHSSGYCLYI